MSEPVSQATLRIVKVFWGLSSSLAYKRHFPAIDWLTSYSLYADKLADWYSDNIGAEFNGYKREAMRILQNEAELDEIVRLVGVDALSSRDRMTMEAAKAIREDYLHQNAFHEVDTFTSLTKQNKMLKLIIDYYKLSIAALEKSVSLDDILNIPVREKMGRSKYIPEENIAELDEIYKDMKAQIGALQSKDSF